MAGSDKSEKPTQQRLTKARKEGNFASTRQFISGAQFLAFVALLHSFGGRWLDQMRLLTQLVLRRALAHDIAFTDWVLLLRTIVLRCIAPIFAVGLGLALLSLGLQLGLTQMGLSVEKLAPDLKRLNPMSRLRNMMHHNVTALVQALILLPICGYAVYAVGSENATVLLSLPMKALGAGVRQVLGILGALLWRGAALFFIFGCVDIAREKHRHMGTLRMTKREVKEEHKQTDGNPQMKARIRGIRRDQARRQMMKQIPTATAVVVNPTHFAVALRYDPETMAAPLVVARGKNYLALRIRKIALEHQVPLVENPPLAQGLYKATDVGQEIPPHLYKAVAEILAYIFRLMNRR